MSANQDAHGAGVPLIIYLQWYADGPVTDGPIDHENVTWCQDRINDSDFAFIRAGKKTQDAITALEARLLAALALSQQREAELAGALREALEYVNPRQGVQPGAEAHMTYVAILTGAKLAKARGRTHDLELLCEMTPLTHPNCEANAAHTPHHRATERKR